MHGLLHHTEYILLGSQASRSMFYPRLCRCVSDGHELVVEILFRLSGLYTGPSLLQTVVAIRGCLKTYNTSSERRGLERRTIPIDSVDARVKVELKDRKRAVSAFCLYFPLKISASKRQMPCKR
jgi:hypothetical protein